MVDFDLTPEQIASLRDKPRAYLGASEIGLCPRKAQYRLRWAQLVNDDYLRMEMKKGFAPEWAPLPPDQIDLPTLGKFEMGTALEAMILRFLRAGGFVIEDTGEDQATVSAGRISGHPDGMIVSSPGGKWDGWILEIKTMHGFGYDAAVGNSKKAGEGLKEWHKDQVTVYCTAAKVPGCLFVYYDRGTGRMKLFPYELEPGRFDTLAKKAAMILNFKALPPMLPVAAWECVSCEFKRQCARDGNGGGQEEGR